MLENQQEKRPVNNTTTRKSIGTETEGKSFKQDGGGSWCQG